MNKRIDLINFINKINYDAMQEADDMSPIDISELHMHKILFILYGKFYAKFNKELFQEPNFQAWKYGPVEIDYRNKNYSKFERISLNNEEYDYLDKILRNYLIKSNPWLLVEYTHDFSCWLNNVNTNKQIPKEQIIKDFKFDKNFD